MNYYDLELAYGLVEAGWRVHLYTSDESDEASSENIVIKHCFRNVYSGNNVARKAFNYLRGLVVSLVDIIRLRGKITHYHVFHFDIREFITVLLIKLTGRKCVLTVHDVECLSGRRNELVSRFMMKMSDGLIVHNDYSMQELKMIRGHEIETTPHAIIPSGNYLKSINPVDKSAAKEKLGIDQDKQVILFFGQIKQNKGVEVLLGAIPGVAVKNDKAFFIVAGREIDVYIQDHISGIDKEVLDKQCQFLTRFIEDDEKDLLYSAADIVVLPYRMIYQSAVLLMAMSYGKCVVTSDIPGMTGVVTKGDNGFVFKDGDSNALSDVLNELLDNPGKCERASSRAIDAMQNEYDWNNIALQAAEFYTRVK